MPAWTKSCAARLERARLDMVRSDKSYSTQKLNLFRWSTRLEGTIAAYRGDSSPRSPPVPDWLKSFVELFKPAVEECLGA